MRHLKIKKIKVSWLWIPALCLFPYLHVTKILIFIFLILTLHECAHMLVAYVFHYTIEEVRLYPFGVSATIPELGYGSICKEIVIISAGPLSQTLLPFLFLCIFYMGWISYDFYQYINMINGSILIFNLLPIYPLDGGRLLQAFFHSFLRFKKAQYLTCLCSVFVLVFLIFFHIISGVSALFVECFLLFEIIVCYRNITHMQLKFYHYRYLHPVSYPILLNQKSDLYRGRFNIMKVKGGWLREDTWLALKFSKARKR